MIRKVSGNIIRKCRFYFNNKRYYKKLLNRIIIVIVFILIIMTFKKISNSFSNNVIRVVKKCITYEFTIREDGKRIFNGAKKLLIVPEKVKEVFNFNDDNIDNWVAPVEGNIYKPYGELKNSDRKIFNKGVDIIPKNDCTIISIGDGTVYKIEDKKNLGYFITIKYEDFEAVYGHLKEISVSSGDSILKGQKIGSLGLYSDGGNRYLHFEIWKNGNPINPEEILKLD